MSNRKPLPKRLRHGVLAAAGHRCEIAGSECTGLATEVDHIRPVSQGGSDSRENLRASCRTCNMARERGLKPLLDVELYHA